MSLRRGGSILMLGNVHVPADVARTTSLTAQRLTALLLDARLAQDEYLDGVDTRPALFRARSRSTGLDISARVVRDGALALVVSVTVRSSRRRP